MLLWAGPDRGHGKSPDYKALAYEPKLPGLASGWGPSNANLGNVTGSMIILLMKGF